MRGDEFTFEDEGVDVEYKAAQGASGKGEVPGAVWESYSAMANTDGGTIVLGVGEQDGMPILLGLAEPDRVRRDFWSAINNTRIVNTNILRDMDVTVKVVGGKSLLWVTVPRAERSIRPVYVGANPMTGTFRRNHDGDFRCPHEVVQRMIAEAITPNRDTILLEQYDMNDLDAETLSAYRNDFKSTRPAHPWVADQDAVFLRNLGGWQRDRATGKEGLTLAGLLMFGRMRSILDYLPNYVVDYQERPLPPSSQRWIDRVTTDGSWSGNLYDFYRRVYQKLTAELKVPFVLQHSSKRVDESPVHVALREALVNALIHADYTGRVPLLIVKRPDLYGFRNPGGLRLPLSVVLSGGVSDCRNRNLQKMFQMVGAGEQAGSGLPKILRAWKEQHWRPPLLQDALDPEQTILRLTTTSLLPQEVTEALDKQFPGKYRFLSEEQRLALATASIEGKVTNERMRAMTTAHSKDLSVMFRNLVDGGFLEPEGMGRGTCYYLVGNHNNDPLEQPVVPASVGSSEQNDNNTTNNSEQYADGSEQNDNNTTNNSEQYADQQNAAHEMAKRVREAGRVPQQQMDTAVLSLCRGKFVSIKQLAQMLNRTPDTLRVHYINRLVNKRLLKARHPQQPNHPEQAYQTVEGNGYF